MKNAMFMEQVNIKQFSLPVDANAGAITGARVSLKTGEKVVFLLEMAGSAGSTVALSLKQHNAITAGTTKALSVANPYFVKAGAATAFTKVEPTVATDLYTLTSTFGAVAGLVAFEVSATNLDVNGGFDHFSVNMAIAGTAKIVSGVYMIVDTKSNPAYDQAL